jgi:isopropylmalate/homocitrate/citramalate synthase
MKKQKLRIFDTTLRDGAQTIGINMSLEDKRQNPNYSLKV